MANPYYDHGTFPTPNTKITSAAMRAELDLIEAGFDRLPVLAANAGRIVAVKSDESGLEALTAAAARTALGLGTIATQAANNVSITGGTITGITGTLGCAALSAAGAFASGATIAKFGSTTTGLAAYIGQTSTTAFIQAALNSDFTTEYDLALQPNGGNILAGAATTFDFTGIGLGIGSTTAAVSIKLTNSATGHGAGNGFDLGVDSSGNAYVYNRENAAIIFGTNNGGVGRFDNSGNLLLRTSNGAMGGIFGLKLDHGATPGIVIAVNEVIKGYFYAYGSGSQLRTESAAGYTITNVSGGSNGVQLTNGATSWSSLSDETTKDIIEPITGALNKTRQLRTVIGKYKDEVDGVRRVFYIAQDFVQVLPEAVDEYDGKLLLRYQDAIPLNTAAINELDIFVQDHESRIAALEGENADIKRRLLALEEA